jgi:hypothetical protein
MSGGWILNLVDKNGDTIRFDEEKLIMEYGKAKFTKRAELIITYNYGGLFYHAFKAAGKDGGVRSLRGMTGKESLKLLDEAIVNIGYGITDIDYLKPTAGNAANALGQVRYLASLCADGVWDCTM